MNTKQAKDFLVQQTAEQAALDNVPLSDIEKRMMYFTESDNASCDNPLEVNDEFEAQYDTAEYEAKISRILHHAYHRLKGEAPERKRMWDLPFVNFAKEIITFSFCGILDLLRNIRPAIFLSSLQSACS